MFPLTRFFHAVCIVLLIWPASARQVVADWAGAGTAGAGTAGAGTATVPPLSAENIYGLELQWRWLIGQGTVWDLSWSPDGSRYVVVLDDGLHLVEAQTLDHRVLPESQGLSSVAWSPDGAQLAAIRDTQMLLWEVASGELLPDPFRYPCGAGDQFSSDLIAFSPDGYTLATASSFSHSADYLSRVDLWDLRTGICRGQLRHFGDWVQSIQFSPDGQYLAVSSYSPTDPHPFHVHIWLSDLRWHICNFPGRQALFTGQEYDLVLDDLEAGHLKRFNARTCQRLQTYTYRQLPVSISPDHTLLAGLSVQDPANKLVFWDMVAGQPVRQLSISGGDFAFSPNQQYLLVGSNGADADSPAVLSLWAAGP